MRFRALVGAVLFLEMAVFAPTVAADLTHQDEATRWWSHIEVLASDRYQGRLTGSEGYRQAADYVAAQFKAEGLLPAGVSGYLQPVGFNVQKVFADRSSVALVAPDGQKPLRIGQDIILGTRIPQPETIDAPLVFIGYGLHLPEVGADDFAGQDLRGKIAVYVNGGPDDIPAALKSHSRAAETWRAAEQAGAVGLISIPLPKSEDIPWTRQMVLASQPGMYLADPTMQDTHGPRFTASFNPLEAQTLFSRSGHRFSDVLDLAEAHKRISGFALNQALKASVAVDSTTVVSSNLLAKIPGSDPILRDQYVIVSAHLDHLGVGAPINGDPIYHGAMDDASGVASVLEIARRLRQSPVAPKRTILFAVVTGEEKGLLGSRYFAQHPTVPKAAIVADLNMDMPLPLWPLHYVMVQGVNESSLGADARAVATQKGYEVVLDPYPDRNSFIRTDQYSFVRNGVPALAFKFGWAPDSPEQQIEKDWRTIRYHSPADNLAQPVNKAAAVDFDDYVGDLAFKVANDPQQARWLSSSFFRRFAAQ